jgi:hypothetical protein
MTDQYLTAGDRLLADLITHIEEISERGEDTAALNKMLEPFHDT